MVPKQTMEIYALFGTLIVFFGDVVRINVGKSNLPVT